jgi:mono/diheme cytochrome c family protein
MVATMRWLFGGICLGAGLAGAGILFVYTGVFDVSALRPHTQLVYWLLETTKRHSVEHHANGIAPPPLADPALIARGGVLYREHCVQCHGAPGIAPEDFAKGLEPLPPNLAQVAREWQPSEIYWAIKHGIKMTAMPAWDYRMDDAALWSVVAFLRELPLLSPAEYRDRFASAEARPAPSAASRSSGARRSDRGADGRGDPERGMIALRQYACVSCHVVPGVVGPDARVGPPLNRIAAQVYLAGRVRNSEENMVRWIMSPREIKPGSAMPDMGVSEPDARDIVAYLRTLH